MAAEHRHSGTTFYQCPKRIRVIKVDEGLTFTLNELNLHNKLDLLMARDLPPGGGLESWAGGRNDGTERGGLWAPELPQELM